MKGILLSGLIALLAVASCASQTAYGPASTRTPNAVGYTDQKVDTTRTRVTFVVPEKAGKETADTLALLRAAELTTTEGHLWFKILKRTIDTVQVETRADRAYASTQSSDIACGQSAIMGSRSEAMVGCGGAPMQTGVSGANAGFEVRFVATIEFAMGDGPMPAGDQVYDAKATAAKIRSAL